MRSPTAAARSVASLISSTCTATEDGLAVHLFHTTGTSVAVVSTLYCTGTVFVAANVTQHEQPLRPGP